MADELGFDVALELARSLKTIDGFPWDADTIKATAEDLTRWCKGGFVNNRMWPAEAQARWLVTSAREGWDKWRGTHELRAMFRVKFDPINEANAVKDWANEPCVCGSGERFRECCQGKPLPPMEFASVKTIRPPYKRDIKEQERLDRIAEQIAELEREERG